MPDTSFPSRTAVAGYSVHVLLTPIPFTCFAGALLTDIAYSRTADMQWANFSAWLLAFGIVFGLLAAVAGLVDFVRRPVRATAAAWVHGIGSALALLLALLNNFVHSRDAWTSVVPTGLTLSALTVAAMLVTGALGFYLVDRRSTGVQL